VQVQEWKVTGINISPGLEWLVVATTTQGGQQGEITEYRGRGEGGVAVGVAQAGRMRMIGEMRHMRSKRVNHGRKEARCG
jgi:hypothetical protein